VLLAGIWQRTSGLINRETKGVEMEKTEGCMEGLQMVHGEEFKRINKRVYDIEETLETGIAEISSIKTSIEFIHKRLDNREAQTEAIIKLSSSVEHMVSQVKELSVDMKEVIKLVSDHDMKIHGIESSNYSDKITDLHNKFNDLEKAKYTKINGYIDSVFKAIFVAIALYLLFIFSNGQIGG
jgi:chromosome segregation ATPase